ncbi:hypothetical protein AMECASPLE_003769, partial [Ameca splendens]
MTFPPQNLTAVMELEIQQQCPLFWCLNESPMKGKLVQSLSDSTDIHLGAGACCRTCDDIFGLLETFFSTLSVLRGNPLGRPDEGLYAAVLKVQLLFILNSTDSHLLPL